MAYEPKDGSGTLFKNDKGDNDKRPDYRGDIMVGGVLYELSSWIKEGAKGKFMSLSAKPKGAQQGQANAAPTRSAPAAAIPLDDDLSDLPF